MTVFLFLDDIRNPEDAYPETFLNNWQAIHVVRSYSEFTEFILDNGLPDHIAFDHDLSDEHYENINYHSLQEYYESDVVLREPTGLDCANWLIYYCIDRAENMPTWTVHSQNPAGRDMIITTLRRFAIHQKRNII